TTLHFMDGSLYEMTSLMGFDGIWIDLEHHSHSLETAAQMMRAARVGTSDIVARPAKGEFMRLARVLEIGASAIMYPQCDNADEASQLVRAAKFPPEGRRGCDWGGADTPYMMMPMEEYLRKANEETLLIAQIESPEALENVEAIAQVPGIDILFLGPGDYSIRLGIPGQSRHPEIRAAEDRIARAASHAGIHWGLPVGSPEQAQDAIDRGARFICHQADLNLMKHALESIQNRFSPLGFTFDQSHLDA
ncbi:MAG: aldolase/citrate lyase family protein, partial [Pirellulaceae bacterium]|nr:aldolase/citrate lyase family protein [Pirellulaceae bacterium]